MAPPFLPKVINVLVLLTYLRLEISGGISIDNDSEGYASAEGFCDMGIEIFLHVWGWDIWVVFCFIVLSLAVE